MTGQLVEAVETKAIKKRSKTTVKNSISEFDDDSGRIAVNLDVGEDVAEFTSKVASVWNQIPMEKKETRTQT